MTGRDRAGVEGRLRRIRRLGLAGTIAAVGAFTGLASAGGADDPAPRDGSPAVSDAPAAQTAPQTTAPQGDDDYAPYGDEDGYFADPGAQAGAGTPVAPGGSQAVPDAASGAS